MDEFFLTPAKTAPLDFPLELMQELALNPDPYAVCTKYGFDYDEIKDLPHFKAKASQVEKSLLAEGALTPVIAAAGLHTAVEKLAYRVADDRIPTGDLVKAIDILKKVKDGSAQQNAQSAAPGVSLVINIPALGNTPAKTIDVTPTKPAAHPSTVPTISLDDDLTITLE